MNPNEKDQLSPVDNVGVALGLTSTFTEPTKISGVYTATMTGPLEEYRDLYIRLRDELAAVEAATAIERARLTSREALIEQLAAIPMEDKWANEIAPNLVTTEGGNNLLDVYLSGAATNATWYMGLISATGYTTGPALTDTMATHAGWVEAVGYSNTTRPAAAWSSAAGKSKSLSSGLVFNMNASATIKGCFLTNISTKGGTTGILFSAGLFTGGDQPVVNGNTLTVSYSASV